MSTHDHDHAAGANERALTIALGLTSTVLVVELVGGILTQSLALISDAAHMFTDAAALGIALLAIRIARRPADAKRTYGYHRFEILAAAFNAVLLFMVAIYIVYEAWQRVNAPAVIDSTTMLAIAVVGLVANLISMKVLASGQEHSLNVRGAYLEVWSDMIGSAGVIVGAIVIGLTGWTWVDSLVAVLIGLWVLPRTWSLLKSSVNILLEGVPHDVDLPEVEATLLGVPGVLGLHDLHIWSVTSGHNTLTVHLVTAPDASHEHSVLPAVRQRLAERHGITHITVQCELTPCPQGCETRHLDAAAAATGPARSH